MSEGKKLSAKNIIEGVLIAIIFSGISWLFVRYVMPTDNNQPTTQSEKSDPTLTSLESNDEQTQSKTNNEQVKRNPSPPCGNFEIQEGQVVECSREKLTFSLFRTQNNFLNELTLMISGNGVDQKIPLLAPRSKSITASDGRRFQVNVLSISREKGVAKVKVSDQNFK